MMDNEDIMHRCEEICSKLNGLTMGECLGILGLVSATVAAFEYAGKDDILTGKLIEQVPKQMIESLKPIIERIVKQHVTESN